MSAGSFIGTSDSEHVFVGRRGDDLEQRGPDNNSTLRYLPGQHLSTDPLGTAVVRLHDASVHQNPTSHSRLGSLARMVIAELLVIA